MSDSQTLLQPRVLHINEQRGWRGGEQQMLYLATGLQKRGLRTGVVLQPESAASRRCAQAGLEVHELKMRAEYDMYAAFKLARIVTRGGYNIIHAHTSHAHMLVLLAARFWRAPARVVVHRRIEFPVGKTLMGLGRLKYTFGVDAYIAISNRVKETLVEAGVPEWRIFPAHSSTDPSRFEDVEPDPRLREELGIPQDAVVIGNIGALVGHKDHDNLMRAARIVRDAIPAAWFVIVGAGPLHAKILERAEALHMADRLTMTGFRHDVPALIKMFDLFALSSSEEGICSTLLDVAVSGCPIVATDAGGVREAVVPEETGIVVPIKKPHALAEGIIKLVRNPDLAKRYAQHGRARMHAHFTADRMTERTLDAYERILAGGVAEDIPIGYLDV